MSTPPQSEARVIADRTGWNTNRRDIAAFAALAAAALLFRLPAILNAAGLNSDAAIVGLQARHILRGEWSWFLWGTNYQGTLDALLSAIAFAVAGATPQVLMAVPLAGYLLLLWLAFTILRRRLSLAPALIAVLPLVCTPYVVNTVTVYPPRQWAITAVFASIWLLDRASASRHPLFHYGLAMAIGAIALYLDLFDVQFLPALGFFGLACVLDGSVSLRVLLRRIGACALGLASGDLLVWRLWHDAPADAGFTATARTSAATLRQNLALFWHQCLPWALSYKIFIPGREIYELDQWQPPAAFLVVQMVGAAALIVGIAFGGAAIGQRRLSWPVRRLGMLGFGFAAFSAAGFLASVSTLTTGVWAARFLAPVIWGTPFALTPIAYRLRPLDFAAAATPYLVAAAVAGWLGFGFYVEGPRPVPTSYGTAQDEARLGTLLRQRASGTPRRITGLPTA